MNAHRRYSFVGEEIKIKIDTHLTMVPMSSSGQVDSPFAKSAKIALVSD